MAEAFVETLLEEIPNDRIRAIYMKGSAKKRWDTPIDYVPKASDLDLHVWFHHDYGSTQFGSLDQAISIQRAVEARYRVKCPRPIHTPRPQLMVMNELLNKPGYMHSPRGTVEVLFGQDYPAADYSAVREIERAKCHDLLDNADGVRRFPLRVVDRPGEYLAEVLRDLGYRVAPAGPIVLHLARLDPLTVWSMNRTEIARALWGIGYCGIAAAYVRYYLARWRWFLSDFDDFDSVRDAVGAALEVIERSALIAKARLSQRN